MRNKVIKNECFLDRDTFNYELYKMHNMFN